MFFSGGLYAMIAKKVTNYYLCVRALRSELRNDAAYVYLAVLMDANIYVSRGQISPTILYYICTDMIQKEYISFLDYICTVIGSLEVLIMCADNPRTDQRIIAECVAGKNDLIRKTVISQLQKCRPSAMDLAGTKALLNSHSFADAVKKAEVIAATRDFYFE